MDILEEAYRVLYPDKPFSYLVTIKYTDRFKPYNANIKMTMNRIELRLSKKWRRVNKDITMGVVQSLLVKLFPRRKPATMYHIDLYNNFVKHLHLSIPKTNIDPILEASFNRVNSQFFYGSLEIPNLVWGQYSKRKLGSYDFKSDTISMSRVLEDGDSRLLDYVMYHELLHKKHKFKAGLQRNRFHSKAFKDAEAVFGDTKALERQLSGLGRRNRWKSIFKR